LRQNDDEYEAMNQTSKVLIIANILMAIAFFYFMYLQFNDEDPVRWELIYAIAGVACLVYLSGRLPRIIPILIGAFALVWALTKIPAVMSGDLPMNQVFGTMQMINNAVKECREMLGLLIVTFWMAILAAFTRKVQPKT
jgi:glucan phosphoethanolaminetransferase (alkaline phosphatase superfamily)